MDKALLGRRIKQRRLELDMTQGDIAKTIGVAISTVQRYEAGAIDKIKLPVVEAIARVINVSPDWLCGKTDIMQPTNRAHPLPFQEPTVTDDIVTFYPIGTVAAGYNKIAYEDYGADPVEIPRRYLAGRPQSDYFVLTVHGDSMYPGFLDGDQVLVLKQNVVDHSGDIAVVLYESDCATLKKVEYDVDKELIKLIPTNPYYPPTEIKGAALEQCRILGVPRLLIRQFTPAALALNKKSAIDG